MNFCNFYNKTMNSIESFWMKLFKDKSSNRDNTISINIFEGLFHILFWVLVSLIGLLIFIIISILTWIYNITTSKCELEPK